MINESGEPLRQFLRDAVTTFEELEALLFLVHHEGQDFSAAAVSSALKAKPGVLDEALERLASAGELVTVTQHAAVPVYRYSPRDGTIRQRVTELEAAYAERRISVVQMLSANAVERVRHAAMRRLADAFRLERRKK